MDGSSIRTLGLAALFVHYPALWRGSVASSREYLTASHRHTLLPCAVQVAQSRVRPCMCMWTLMKVVQRAVSVAVSPSVSRRALWPAFCVAHATRWSCRERVALTFTSALKQRTAQQRVERTQQCLLA